MIIKKKSLQFSEAQLAPPGALTICSEKKHYLFSSRSKWSWFSVGSSSTFWTLGTIFSTLPEHAQLTLWHDHKTQTQICSYLSYICMNTYISLLALLVLQPSSPGLLWFPCHPWNLGNHPHPEREQRRECELDIILFPFIWGVTKMYSTKSWNSGVK